MNKKLSLKNAGTFLVFGGPSIFAFAAVVIIPFIVGLYLTFTNWDVRTGDSSLIGFANYLEVFRDKVFLQQLWFTLKYVFFTVVIANVFAFFIALALTRGGRGSSGCAPASSRPIWLAESYSDTCGRRFSHRCCLTLGINTAGSCFRPRG